MNRCRCTHSAEQHEHDEDWCNARGCACERFHDQAQGELGLDDLPSMHYCDDAGVALDPDEDAEDPDLEELDDADAYDGPPDTVAAW